MNQEFYNIVDDICEKDPRYKSGAYEFVMEALAFSQRRFRRAQHVPGLELLEGIKELLMIKFGPMTLNVLTHWGIKTTDDFGHIVHHLVEERILKQDKEDNIDSFRNGFNFEEVFKRDYRRKLEKTISRMRY